MIMEQRLESTASSALLSITEKEKAVPKLDYHLLCDESENNRAGGINTDNEMLLPGAWKEQLDICEKQKRIFRKSLEQESADHMETAHLLDRTLELNSALTKALYEKKVNYLRKSHVSHLL
jgi:hypothetical protein